MFFDAKQTQGAIGAVVPEQSAHTPGQGQGHNLNKQQFPGQGAPEDAAGADAAAGAGEAAAGAGAELAELAPLALAL